MTPDERIRAFARLHAVMAHTMANGCTEDEELSAARMAGRLADELAPDQAGADGDGEPTAAQRLQAERQSADYIAALERNTMEGLLKSAIQELSMAHLNLVSPPQQRLGPHERQWVDVRALLGSHLSMALSVSGGHAARQILAETIEELIQDGMLPERIAVRIQP